MAANESTKDTHFSNVAIGTASGGGNLTVAGLRQNVGAAEVVAADTTLTAADNGKTIYLDDTTGEAITLPAVAAGLHFKFVVASTFITDNWTVASAETGNIDGSIVVAGEAVIAAVEDQINFVASAETLGDYVNLHSDGVQWFVDGVAALTGGITATGG